MTQHRLKELFTYCPLTGLFVRNTKVNQFDAESIAGYKSDGYGVMKADGKAYKQHRLAFLYMTGSMPEQVDHVNHDRFDNRWDNLREADTSMNMRNRPTPGNNTSGVVGVYWYKETSRWTASIGVDGKQIHLGSFSKFSEAVDARKLAEVAYGFHENHGKDVA